MECEYKDCQIKKANDMNCPIEQFSVPAASCKTLSIFKAGQSSGEAKERERCVGVLVKLQAEIETLKEKLKGFFKTVETVEDAKIYMMKNDGCKLIEEAINRLGE